jgi:hypothetical protein
MPVDNMLFDYAMRGKLLGSTEMALFPDVWFRESILEKIAIVHCP